MKLDASSLPFFPLAIPALLRDERLHGAPIARAALAALPFLLAAGTTAAAQGVCFEPSVTAVVATNPGLITTADIDGDSDLDLVVVLTSGLHVSRNLGNGTFAPQEFVYLPADSANIGSLVAADFDGDADVDIAIFRTWNPGGGGITAGVLHLLRNDGTGAFTTPPVGTHSFTDPVGILGADFDGDSDQDLLVTHRNSPQTVYLLRNDGAGTFTSYTSTLPVNAASRSAVWGDLDGDLDLDIVSQGATNLYTLQNDGNGNFSVLQAYSPTAPVVLTDLDGDGDRDLVSVGFTTAYVLTVRLNAGNGTLSSETIIPGFSGLFLRAEDVTAGDVDADGDVDLVVAAGWAPRLTVLANLGNATFDVMSDLVTDVSHFLRQVRIADLDGDGDVELLSVNVGAGEGVLRFRGCRTAGEPICLGDGTGAGCPCGNNSSPSAVAGCLNSFGTAGTLRGTGSARLTNDTLVLNGTGMTNASALYFQGSIAASGGAGAPFGDGLRCASGSVNRLGVRSNVGGASVLPGPMNPSVSAVGFVMSPGERIYQTWYRNTASFCAPEGFNLTNGLRVLWAP